MLARGRECSHVTLQRGFEGLPVLPLRMLRRQRPDAVDGEEELEVDGPLGPEGTIVVKHGDAFPGRNVVRPRPVGHSLDEVSDGLPRGSLVP